MKVSILYENDVYVIKWEMYEYDSKHKEYIYYLCPQGEDYYIARRSSYEELSIQEVFDTLEQELLLDQYSKNNDIDSLKKELVEIDRILEKMDSEDIKNEVC